MYLNLYSSSDGPSMISSLLSQMAERFPRSSSSSTLQTITLTTPKDSPSLATRTSWSQSFQDAISICRSTSGMTSLKRLASLSAECEQTVDSISCYQGWGLTSNLSVLPRKDTIIPSKNLVLSSYHFSTRWLVSDLYGLCRFVHNRVSSNRQRKWFSEFFK